MAETSIEHIPKPRTDSEPGETSHPPLIRKSFQRVPIRLLNRGSVLLRRSSPRVLSIDELHETAAKQTGLSDFGPDTYWEPLGQLVDALKDTAGLNAFGERLAPGVLLQTLRNRLLIQDEWKRSPEASRVPVRQPIMILGLPRSGTTLLFGLMSCDRRHRFLADWETEQPIPANSRWERQRWLRRSRWKLKRAGLNYVAPRVRHIHELRVDGPAECGALLMNEFTYPGFGMMYNVPSYREWLQQYDYRPAIRFYHRQLRLLQNLYPGERWLLKCPSHLSSIDALLETYPDMCIVQTHRDPVEAVPSECSLFEVLQGLARDEVDAAEIGHQVTQNFDRVLRRSVRSRSTADPARFMDIHYEELVRQPIEAVRSIYDHFGLELDAEAEAAMRRKLSHSPQAKWGVHHYSLEEFGIDEARLRDTLGWYYERFDIPHSNAELAR